MGNTFNIMHFYEKEVERACPRPNIIKGRNIEQLEWMKHLRQWNINLIQGDGLAVLTSVCESRLALDQMMTESLSVPLITSIHIYFEYTNVPNISSLHFIECLCESTGETWSHIDFPF